MLVKNVIKSYLSPSRLQRIVMVISPNQNNQPNLDLYLVRRYTICHFTIVLLYLCIGQNQKNQPNMVLYLVRRSKIFVSVATLVTISDCHNICLSLYILKLSFISFHYSARIAQFVRSTRTRPWPQNRHQFQRRVTGHKKRLYFQSMPPAPSDRGPTHRENQVLEAASRALASFID